MFNVSRCGRPVGGGVRRREITASRFGRGQAMVEATLTIPLLLFLFLGATNFGFYVYAFISVTNAARVAAHYTANPSFVGNQGVACQAALRELRSMSNVASLNSCAAAPLVVTAVSYPDPDGTTASRVDVSYTTIQLFPLPFMSGQMTINRTAFMRVF